MTIYAVWPNFGNSMGWFQWYIFDPVRALSFAHGILAFKHRKPGGYSMRYVNVNTYLKIYLHGSMDPFHGIYHVRKKPPMPPYIRLFRIILVDVTEWHEPLGWSSKEMGGYITGPGIPPKINVGYHVGRKTGWWDIRSWGIQKIQIGYVTTDSWWLMFTTFAMVATGIWLWEITGGPFQLASLPMPLGLGMLLLPSFGGMLHRTVLGDSKAGASALLAVCFHHDWLPNMFRRILVYIGL